MNRLTQYKFSKLYQIDSGISTTKSQAGHGAPFVSFSTIFNNYYLPDVLDDLMDTSEKEQKTYSVKKGDIFLTRTSETMDELAMSCVALKDYPKATFSGFAKRLRPLQSDITYDKFMAFYLRSNYFRRVIINHTNMTLRASFNEDIFSYIKLYLPDYKDQVKIGDFLYNLEEKRKTNIRIIELLNKKINKLFQYWFLNFEFPYKNMQHYASNGGMLEVKKGSRRKIPTIFDNIPVSLLVNIKSEKKINPIDFPDILFKHYSIPAYDKYGTYLLENGEAIKSEKYIVNDSDVLVSKLNPRFSRVIIPEKTKNTISSTEFVIWNTKENYIRNFLYALAKNQDFINYCMSNATGTSNSHKRIDPEIMLDYKVAANNEYIKIFGNKIKNDVEAINQFIIENRKIENAINYMLPLFVSGQAGFDNF